MLRKRLLARMSRLHKTYTYDRTVVYEAKPASPWGRTVVFDFTINAASSLVPCPCPGWATSGPHTSNAFSQAMIQTFSSTSFGVAGLPSHFNKPWGDSIIHWSSRTIGWHLTYRPPGLLTVIHSPQFPEGPFEIRTSCTTLSRLPIAVELRCSTMQIFRLHFPTYSCSPQHKCGHHQSIPANSSHHEHFEGLQAPDCSLPRVSVLSTPGRPLSLSSSHSFLLLFFWISYLVLSCSSSRSIAWKPPPCLPGSARSLSKCCRRQLLTSIASLPPNYP